MSATPSVPGSSPLTTPAETVPLAGQHIVVVGGGMTAHRFSSRLRAQDPVGGWSLSVSGEEPQQPYDRVHLSNWFSNRNADLLSLDTAVWSDPRITLSPGDPAVALDRDAQTVPTRDGPVHSYDRLVLATGSWAWSPRAEEIGRAHV